MIKLLLAKHFAGAVSWESVFRGCTIRHVQCFNNTCIIIIPLPLWLCSSYYSHNSIKFRYYESYWQTAPHPHYLQLTEPFTKAFLSRGPGRGIRTEHTVLAIVRPNQLSTFLTLQLKMETPKYQEAQKIIYR